MGRGQGEPPPHPAPRISGHRRTDVLILVTKACAARLQAVIKRSTLFTGNSVKTRDAQGRVH